MKKILKVVGEWAESSDDPRVSPCLLPKYYDERIIDYLKSGHEFSAYMGYSYCRFECGVPDHVMGSRELHDGTYIWPEGLFHYVSVHSLKLPDYFLKHIANNKYRVPDLDEEYSDDELDFKEWLEWSSQYKVNGSNGYKNPDLYSSRIDPIPISMKIIKRCLKEGASKILLGVNDLVLNMESSSLPAVYMLKDEWVRIFDLPKSYYFGLLDFFNHNSQSDSGELNIFTQNLDGVDYEFSLEINKYFCIELSLLQ